VGGCLVDGFVLVVLNGVEWCAVCVDCLGWCVVFVWWFYIMFFGVLGCLLLWGFYFGFVWFECCYYSLYLLWLLVVVYDGFVFSGVVGLL